MSETTTGGNTDLDGVRGVGCVARIRQGTPRFTWAVEDGGQKNYRRLGKYLARCNPNLFRNTSEGHGLVHVSAGGACRLITKAAQLAPALVDSLTMRVMREGKVVSELPAAA